MTYQQLTAELKTLNKRIERAWQAERRNVLQQIRELMTTWDIQSNELRRYRRGTYKTKPVVPKYRDPVSGKTWSGRGRIPAWIAGKDRAVFLIEREQPESAFANVSQLRRRTLR
ncbi:H-NS family nucleoid-associated regulatory protein [Burkholderia vietnamiensis]|uniref:H-NS histone family protein n=1 Tax=Burkholderia vietnamiensis TaxID=60552 RepID=UPI001E4A6E09|nr:H-NS histone family protein [Burkholderia vietnamiensis]